MTKLITSSQLSIQSIEIASMRSDLVFNTGLCKSQYLCNLVFDTHGSRDSDLISEVTFSYDPLYPHNVTKLESTLVKLVFGAQRS